MPDELTPEELALLSDLEGQSRGQLQTLLKKLQRLHDTVQAEEPAEDSETYVEWMEELEEVEDCMDEIRDLLEDQADA